MIKFAKINSDTDGASRFVVTDDGEELATVETAGNTIKNVFYRDPGVDARYGDFTLRSTVYVLRDKFSVVKAAFVDKRLSALGFVEENGCMQADSLKIRFDNCQGGCN